MRAAGGAVVALVGLGALARSTASQVARLRQAGTHVARLEQDLSLPGRAPTRTLAVLGDSAAAGHGLPHADAGLARQVGRRLAARTGRGVVVRCLAVDGATTADVLADQVGALGPATDVVIVGVGVNDAVRGRRPREVRSTTARLLAALAAGVPDAEVVLLTCPDLGSAPGLPRVLRPVLRWSCRRVAGAQRAVAAGSGVAVVRADGRLPSAAFGPDGFHPGPRGIAILADRVDDVLRTRVGGAATDGSGGPGQPRPASTTCRSWRQPR